MAEKVPQTDRQEKLRAMMEALNVDGLVEQTRAKVAKARVEGREPWEVGRSDVHELLACSNY